MDSTLLARVQGLGDLELALLLSMVAELQCMFSTAIANVRELQEELRLSCIGLFGIHPVVVECSPRTTVDDFSEALLVEADESREEATEDDASYASVRLNLMANFQPTRQPTPVGRLGSLAGLENRRIADIVVVTGLDTASDGVQVQAFELLRSGRFFTRSAMHVAPKDFLFLSILSKPGARLTRHLNDMFCMSHFHAEYDGFPHLERQFERLSVPAFAAADIKELTERTADVRLTAEVAEYLHNVVIFMRNSRYVKGGVTAAATRQLRLLSMALATLHDLDYVPPSIVALAARKVYPHRIMLATSDNEKSLLWGSDPRAVKALLKGVIVEDVIEDVLASVETPL